MATTHTQGMPCDELSGADNFLNLENNNLDAHLKNFKRKPIIQEWGFVFPMGGGSNVWEIMHAHKWENFGKHPSELACIPIVQEFYASLKEYDAKRPLGEPWLCYEVPIYMYDIKRTNLKFCLNISLEEVIDYLTEGKGEWQRDLATNLLIFFHPSRMIPLAKR
ncbi:hypothetical protein J1N35_018745 [Gossypium stocksii]|uniref:Uncharacterized protein n=1 Tax=Gossypium stocksii TaxID=47602 RepID=A0A9D3VRS8_9ROSI|nr:hypothetical protein J1N35_018745 [Gossypium stocksii]